MKGKTMATRFQTTAQRDAWCDDPASLVENARRVMFDAFPRGADVTVIRTWSNRGGDVHAVKVYAVWRGEVSDMSNDVARVTGRRISSRGVEVGIGGGSPTDHLVRGLARDLYGDDYALARRELTIG